MSVHKLCVFSGARCWSKDGDFCQLTTKVSLYFLSFRGTLLAALRMCCNMCFIIVSVPLYGIYAPVIMVSGYVLPDVNTARDHARLKHQRCAISYGLGVQAIHAIGIPVQHLQ